MTSYLYHSIFTVKKQKTLIITLMLVMICMVLFLDLKVSLIERMTYHSHYLVTYESIISQSFIYILPVVNLMIMTDHEQGFILPLIAYHGRLKVVLGQICVYLIVLSLSYGSLYLFYMMIMRLYFIETSLSISIQFNFLSFLLDGYMLMFFHMILTLKHYKTVSFLIVLIYIISHMVLLDLQHHYIYYLWPISNSVMQTHHYGLIYKLVYIITLSFIVINLRLHRDLSLHT